MDFRVQAVEGYFIPTSQVGRYYMDFEGVGGVYAEFSITIPNYPEEPSISAITTTTPSPSPTDPVSQPNSLRTYLTLILAAACIIIIPTAVVKYLDKHQKLY
ncbi:MAG: hypothetical protein FWD52_04025 [Candidatus Bathyarchaeota archaeon]|nr:hypothetical protein [Candidatus Termiticorpusculum sp.]